MSRWPSTQASRILSALLRIGGHIKRTVGWGQGNFDYFPCGTLHAETADDPQCDHEASYTVAWRSSGGLTAQSLIPPDPRAGERHNAGRINFKAELF